MKKYFFFGMLLFVTISTKAQIDSSQHSPKIMYFGEEAIRKNESYVINHSIKWAFSDLMFGMWGLHYEQKIIKKWTIEIGAGITTLNALGNFLRKGPTDDTQDQVSPTFTLENDLPDDDYDFDSRKAGRGFFYSAAIRYYYIKDEKGLDGFYISLKYLFRKYNDEAYGLSPVDAVNGSVAFDDNQPRIEEFENNTSLSLAWGKQTCHKNFSFDMTCGMGIIFINGERRDIGFVNNNSSYLRTTVVAENPRITSRTLPYFEISLKIGFGWH